jgi:hypothetical protein
MHYGLNVLGGRRERGRVGKKSSKKERESNRKGGKGKGERGRGREKDTLAGRASLKSSSYEGKMTCWFSILQFVKKSSDKG